MTEPKVLLSPEDRAGAWGADLEAEAVRALALAGERLGLSLDSPPTIRSLWPESEFYDALGREPHSLVAVALAGENLVLVNRSVFLATSRGERRATLVHEFSHLVVGRTVPGGVPRWLDEGLAMIVESRGDAFHHTRLVSAATFGRLKPLDELWISTAEPDQSLAYAQSLSATRFLLREYGHPADDPRRFLARLAHDEDGGRLRGLLHDARYLAAFESRWRDSVRTFWTVVAAVTADGFLFLVISLLFLLVYWRKKRMARLKEEEWRRDEPWNDPDGEGDPDGAFAAVPDGAPAEPDPEDRAPGWRRRRRRRLNRAYAEEDDDLPDFLEREGEIYLEDDD